MLPEIELIIISALPSLVSIISIITAVTSITKSLDKLKENEHLKLERDKLVEQHLAFIDESRRLRKTASLLIEKTSHVVYKDLTEVKNDEDLQI